MTMAHGSIVLLGNISDMDAYIKCIWQTFGLLHSSKERSSSSTAQPRAVSLKRNLDEARFSQSR